MSDFIIVMACFGLLVIFGGIWATILDILEDWRDDERRRKYDGERAENETRTFRG